MRRGAMDKNVIVGLINSISRFIHLVACQTMKSSDLNCIKYIVRILKLLKQTLDDTLDIEIPSYEQLIRAVEELDIAVNKSRELMEKQSNKRSKIYSDIATRKVIGAGHEQHCLYLLDSPKTPNLVTTLSSSIDLRLWHRFMEHPPSTNLQLVALQFEPMALKVRDESTKICHFLITLLQSSSQSAIVQNCMQELQFGDLGLTSEAINVALKDQRENVIPSLDDIVKITETLALTSTHELLQENIALEKERMKAELEKNAEEMNHVSELIALVSHLRCCMAKFEQFGFITGVPVPSHFRCSLSLELMLDPVIVASGQTYERSFIQKWFDNGLRICPKTRQILSHTNLIPNFTVKALIANWCEDNNIRSCHHVQPESISLKNLSGMDSFHGSTHRDSISRSEISFACSEEESRLANHHKVIIEKSTSQSNMSVDQQSCTHSRSESISSAVSSTDISSKYDEKVCLLESTHPSSSPSHKVAGMFNDDDLITSSHVSKLIEDLKCHSEELQIAAASELRRIAKHNMDNRILIAKCGAIKPLLSLLTSKVKKIQENAVTALLNLSLNDSNKSSIAEAGAIEPLIHVLEHGSSEAQENSAAALFSLSCLEEYKSKIGQSGAIKALVNLLGYGSLRGKKDAATALFNLSIFHENKVRIIRAGAIKYLIELMDTRVGMVDKSVALLANLSTIPEGRIAVAQEGGIPVLVETVETGTQRGKENAASALYQMCINSPKFSSLVLQEGAVPPLVALSQFGTPRAKEKAQQILSHFRSQREGSVRKPKPVIFP